jgi:ribosomal protein S17
MRYFLMFLLFIAFPAVSAPKDEVHKAYLRFLAMTSFKAELNSTSGKYKSKSVVEFQAPDRYRITSDGRPASLIIGGTMYMNMDGHSMKIPMPGLKAMLAQYRNLDTLKELEAGVVVESLGSETINNQVTKKYRYTTSKPQVSNNIMWIANNGDIVQLETSGAMSKKPSYSLIKYSQYNDPGIKISMP